MVIDAASRARRFPARALLAWVLTVPLGVASPAFADTWALAQWGFGPLDALVEGPGTASIPAQSFDLFQSGTVTGAVSASAQVDQLNLGTSAAFSTLNTTPIVIVQAVSRARAQTGDLLTAYGLSAGTPGFIAFRGTVSGSNVATLSATTGASVGATTTSVYTSLTGYRTDTNNFAPSSGTTPNYDWIVFLPEFGSPEHTAVPVELLFPITYETPAGFYFVLLSSIRIEFDPTVAVTFDAASDFGSTFTITDVELQDQDHMPVPNASLTASSGTTYPGMGSPTTTTTTLTGATTTTTQPVMCVGLVGLARAQCVLDAAAAAALCTEPIPAAVEKALRARLDGARAALTRAIAATGRKQARLTKAVGRKLRALAARAGKAAKSKNPKKQITAACGASLEELATTAAGNLP